MESAKVVALFYSQDNLRRKDIPMPDFHYYYEGFMKEEVRHVFQHRKVDAYDQVSDEMKSFIFFSDAETLKDYFTSYLDGLKDFYNYHD